MTKHERILKDVDNGTIRQLFDYGYEFHEVCKRYQVCGKTFRELVPKEVRQATDKPIKPSHPITCEAKRLAVCSAWR